MESRLANLESQASILEPDAAERRHLRDAVVSHAEEFLEGLEDRLAYVVTDHKGAGLSDMPIRETGRAIEDLLERWTHDVEVPGLNPASGGHLAYIPGGGIYPSSLGDYLAAITNRYAGVFFASPGAVRMENLMVRWMADIIGYPEGAGGDLSSGGSIANLTAIVTAREAKGVDSERVRRSVIYATEQVHHCVGKAIGIAGLKEAPVRRVAMDSRFRMEPEDLANQMDRDREDGLDPFLVVASGGTTDTGAVDPIGEIARVAKARDAWFHVDAAYGGFFVLTPEAPDPIRELHLADSVVLDPHKGLFLPYGSGALLVRDRELLYKAHRYDANYMRDTHRSREEPSPADHSPELTRHFRGLRLWLPLQLFGVAPFRACLSEKIWLTRYFYEKLHEIPHMELGPDPELSVCLFRHVPPGKDADAVNARLIEEIQSDGRVFLSSTHVNGNHWLRLAVLAFRTHRSTVDRALDVIRALVDKEARS
ncbi:MAG: aminotransferase class V-fold PLP-dependent enzyme [Gemmatimonadetes bacterium]|nr:aminotransferase class V-fold PLP-dependent enzyme [Gemmatimonadota bacterium]NNM35410.1 aminotransferase class V-fold PLP-dependent enzyme [Gemmatimonadota bacterium]